METVIVGLEVGKCVEHTLALLALLVLANEVPVAVVRHPCVTVRQVVHHLLRVAVGAVLA